VLAVLYFWSLLLDLSNLEIFLFRLLLLFRIQNFLLFFSYAIIFFFPLTFRGFECFFSQFRFPRLLFLFILIFLNNLILRVTFLLI
jgi:hypothetical protein